MGGIAKLPQEVLAVLPNQSEGPHISDTQTSHDVANVREVLRVELLSLPKTPSAFSGKDLRQVAPAAPPR